jgi:hypothetical protein
MAAIRIDYSQTAILVTVPIQAYLFALLVDDLRTNLTTSRAIGSGVAHCIADKLRGRRSGLLSCKAPESFQDPRESCLP